MNVSDAWRAACARVLAAGEHHESRNGGATELLGVQLRIDDPGTALVANVRRNVSSTYAAAELLWYLARSDELRHIGAYAPQYHKFAEDDGTLWGAYGPRLTPRLVEAVKELKTPQSRRVVVTVWEPRDLGANKRDVPCTLSLQFVLRRGILHMIVTMRSEDVWLGLPYDAFCFMSLHRIVAQNLGKGIGEYVHQVGSLHVYDKDLAKVREAAEAPDAWWVHDRQRYERLAWEDVEMAVALERRYRLGALHHDEVRLPTMLRDLVSCCKCRWTTTPEDEWTNSGMKEQSDAHRRGHGPNRKDDAVPVAGQ